MCNGGRNRTRTCDLRCVKPMLYQLSYAPAMGKYTKFAGSELDPSRSATSACMGEAKATPDGWKMPCRRPSVALHQVCPFPAKSVQKTERGGM